MCRGHPAGTRTPLPPSGVPPPDTSSTARVRTHAKLKARARELQERTRTHARLISPQAGAQVRLVARKEPPRRGGRYPTAGGVGRGGIGLKSPRPPPRQIRGVGAGREPLPPHPRPHPHPCHPPPIPTPAPAMPPTPTPAPPHPIPSLRGGGGGCNPRVTPPFFDIFNVYFLSISVNINIL